MQCPKPSCSLANNLFEVKYSYTCSYKIFSKTLATLGKAEIGRWLFKSSLSPGLYTGATLPIFRSSGNTLVNTEP